MVAFIRTRFYAAFGMLGRNKFGGLRPYVHRFKFSLIQKGCDKTFPPASILDDFTKKYISFDLQICQKAICLESKFF